MLQSKLLTKTRREAPKDEVSKNAKLLIMGGFIHKEMAGVYSFLPLGLRVLNKINNIIREEMNAIDGQEISMTALQNPELWRKTERLEMDVAFKTKLKDGGELPLAWTHEEAVTNIVRDHIKSYRDLPKAVYQIQTKFRNEERAKSGILRGREFLMKDLYSFHTDQADLDKYYERAKEAYLNIYRRVGLGDKTFVTFALGGAFSKYSHEFQTVSDAGEDTIYISKEKGLAINKEALQDEVLAELGVKREELEEASAIEVGNIFKLVTRFSIPLELYFTDEKGETKPVVMGCYGIGPGRVMGTVAEVCADDKGVIWPKEIAPFTVHLTPILGKSEAVKKASDELYKTLQEKGVEVLYDDREVSPGEKFADSDLLGIPYRVVLSEKTIADGKLELKDRKTGEVKMVSEEELFGVL